MSTLQTRGHLISHVVSGSIADRFGICPGDILYAINGKQVSDVLDYRFLCAADSLVLDIMFRDGILRALDIKKEYESDLGLEFDNAFMDDYRACQNKCIFCFIDQLPPGMRDTLYFKDDDSRLSFLHGNYVTLTNMTDEDVSRILKLKMSPVNISIHTTDKKLRCEMLNNRFAGDALKKIDVFFHAKIPMNGQIVLCKGINDGDRLMETVAALTQYIPVMESVSIVPVGLTKYRDGCYPLAPFNADDAKRLIEKIEKLQSSLMRKYHTHFVHLSDEWYVLAKQRLPKAVTYDGYPQIENGVGMLRSFIEEVKCGLTRMKRHSRQSRTVSIVTGVSAYPYLRKISGHIEKRTKGLKINVFKAVNHFFGSSVTVSGLLTGADIIRALQGKELGDVCLVPENAFRDGTNVLLDDLTIKDLEKALGVRVKKSGTTGEGFLRALGFK